MKVYFEKGLTVINTGDPVGGCKNKTGYNGVYFRKANQTYHTRVQYKRKAYSLGEFKNLEDAVAYYNLAKQHIATGTFLEWHQTLYGKTKRKRPRSETK